MTPADRQRAYRERQRDGTRVLSIPISDDGVDLLVTLGLLDTPIKMRKQKGDWLSVDELDELIGKSSKRTMVRQ